MKRQENNRGGIDSSIAPAALSQDESEASRIVFARFRSDLETGG
jgi:hypothetical protein